MSIPATPSPDESPGRIAAGKSLESVGSTPTKPPGSFESEMNQARSSMRPQEAASTQGPSPMDLARGSLPSPGSLSTATLLAQARQAQDALGHVSKQLQTKDLKFKRSQNHLLKNKLQDAQGHLRGAAAKLGVPQEEFKTSSSATPIERFLSYLNDGQEQMNGVQRKLEELSAKGQQINPADMLAVQVKINAAQQEIEYASLLLSKVVESIRTVINVQL